MTSSKCENCAAVNTNINSAFSSSQQVSAAPTNLQGTNLTIKITMGKKTIITAACISWIAFSPRLASAGSLSHPALPALFPMEAKFP